MVARMPAAGMVAEAATSAVADSFAAKVANESRHRSVPPRQQNLVIRPSERLCRRPSTGHVKAAINARLTTELAPREQAVAPKREAELKKREAAFEAAKAEAELTRRELVVQQQRFDFLDVFSYSFPTSILLASPFSALTLGLMNKRLSLAQREAKTHSGQRFVSIICDSPAPLQTLPSPRRRSRFRR